MNKSIVIFLLLLYITTNIRGQYYAPEIIIDFETPEYQKYISYEPDSGNIWQIGRPQKAIFNSGVWSSEKAIITDTINTYPVNISNSFKVNVNFDKIEYYLNPAIFLMFLINFDTDSLKDGIKIEYSINDSVWYNITELLGFPNVYHCMEYYTYDDTVLSLNSPGFSGLSKNWKNNYTHSSDWFWVEFYFELPDTQEDSIAAYFKFTFASDSIDNSKEGCAIDHIVITYDEKTTIGYKDIISPQTKFCHIYPNPCNNIIQISSEYDDIHEIKIIDLTGKILYNKFFEKTTELDLTKFNNGIYFIKIKTSNKTSITKLLKM